MFVLDERLAGDTHLVGDLPLCRVLLMNESRYPWLIAVPRQAGLTEVTQLDADARAQLWQDIERIAEGLPALARFDKLNIGALGNVVAQLHVHVVGRRRDDPAWPGPVWGHSPAVPYTQPQVRTALETLRPALSVE
ncbi:HIT domain-containing protein [Oleiagrimonas sp. C23AA]|uniref:HIT domain-containing protein n=1 Tax=Oleiagrimonas sp. C23AA TaxID=2719047 RepID=UPI00141EBDAD|nr:HIT domain-containing protein [Oleiagrimonas sp. C23AA]NII10110.1 HIT domain-containing protein [Oleiagrimonas sp. C23AA]